MRPAQRFTYALPDPASWHARFAGTDPLSPPPPLTDPDALLTPLDKGPLAGVLAGRAGSVWFWPSTAGGDFATPHRLTSVPVGVSGVRDNRLQVVDIDGDGAVELFPLAAVLDGIRSPAQEWSANQKLKAACVPKFSLYDVKLTPEAEPGKAPDAKAVVLLDLLGVVDLDGDGRKELVIALRFPTVRTVVVYTATSSPQRLELAGEAQSFQK